MVAHQSEHQLDIVALISDPDGSVDGNGELSDLVFHALQRRDPRGHHVLKDEKLQLFMLVRPDLRGSELMRRFRQWAHYDRREEEPLFDTQVSTFVNFVGRMVNKHAWR